MLLCISICLMLFIFLYLFFAEKNKRKVIVPSTKWKRGNMYVEIIYVTKDRIYFRTLDDITASMLIEDFVTQFSEVEENGSNYNS